MTASTSSIRLDGQGKAHPGWGRLTALALSGAAVVLFAVLVPVIPFGRAIWDFVFVLDGAYRIGLGQLPHVDFASPVGSLTLFLTAWAERLLAGANPFVAFHALMWIATLPVLAMLAPRFETTVAFVAATLLTAFMILVPYTVENTHLSEISYFASYNRFATGLLFLVGLWYVLPKSRFDWLLLACLLTLLFFLKITAAAMVVCIIVAAVVFGRARISTLAGALAAFLCILAAVELGTGMVFAYLADVGHMASVNEGGVVYALFFAAFRNWAALAAAGLIVLLCLPQVLRQPRADSRRPLLPWLLDRFDFPLAAIVLVTAALLAESQNTGGLGLVAAAALFFHPRIREGTAARQAAVVLLAAALFLPVADILVKRPLTAAKRERIAVADNPIEALLPGTRVPVATFEGARLISALQREMLPLAREVSAAGFFLDPDPTTNAPAAQLAWAISAVEAARAFEDGGYRDAASRYATLAFADPFTRMLGLVPARGTMLVLDVGRTMPVLSEAEARIYLSDANGVFVDRCRFVSSGNEATFDAVLENSFERLPLHPCWDFYRRVPAS